MELHKFTDWNVFWTVRQLDIYMRSEQIFFSIKLNFKYNTGKWEPYPSQKLFS